MSDRRYNTDIFEEWRQDYAENNPGVHIPVHKVVCPSCDGNGRYVNPSIDANGITASEMDELGDDFRESYVRGDYDITCRHCGGRNVVDTLNDDAPADMKQSYDEYVQGYREYQAEMAAERRAFGY